MTSRSRRTKTAAPPVRTEEEIVDISVADELSQSFVSYALSTIVARALPDIRDGLKPVHRRVLYAMEQSRMWPSTSYRKSAQVVGTTMARFHPHGDAAIYDTLVRLAQPFSLRLPLVDGHGNFGSLDDGPAASRYCVVGSTRVFDAAGRATPIREIVGVEENCDVDLALSIRGRLGERVEVSRGFHSGTHDVLRLETSAGFTIAGSCNHLVLCLLPVFGVPVLQWVRLDELVPGMHVAIARPQDDGIFAADLDETSVALGASLVDATSLPDVVWVGDWSVKRGVVAGLFASGAAVATTVSFASCEMAAGIQEVLAHLGVVTWRAPSGDVWDLTVRDSVSQERLAALCCRPAPVASPVSPSAETVPYLAEFIVDEYGADDAVAAACARYRVRSRSVEDAEAVEQEWSHVARQFTADLFFDVVEEVTEGPAEAVYSLRVDTDEHAFLAGGFVNHNTECRLDPAGKALLDDLHEETVAWVPTYDNSELEPMVLPASFPNLLVNGAQGIAVGFSCSIPPHNLDEVVAALVHTVDNPGATNEELQAFIAGPDFPTGGEVVDTAALASIYATGRGTFKLRARAEIVDVSARRRAVVVSELPYQVGPERVVAEVRDLVRDKKLTGLGDVRDLSDRKEGLKLVFDVKSGADADTLCAELFARTSLETTVACSFVVLDGGRPVQADLARLCHAYVDHRRDVIRRRSQYRLDRAEKRIHLLEGLVRALDAIDDVVAIVRSSPDDATARASLMSHPRLLLSQEQAEHVLDLQLRRLTRLSATKLTSDLAAASATAKKLSAILGSKKKLDAVVVDELRVAASAFSAERRTGLGLSWSPSPAAAPLSGAAALPAASTVPCRLAVTLDGDHLVAVGDGPVLARAHIDTTEGSDIWVVSSRGTVHVVDTLIAAPDASAPSKQALRAATAPKGAVPIASVAGLESGAHVVAVLAARRDVPLGVVTRRGVVKRIAAEQLGARSSEWGVITLDDGDELVAAGWAPDDAEFVLVSRRASLLRTSAGKVRPQGRPAGGVVGMKVSDGDEVVAAGVVGAGSYVACAAPSGRAKVTPVADFPLQGRGGAGVRSMRFTGSDTALAWAMVAMSAPRAVSGEQLPVAKRDGSGALVGPGPFGVLGE